MWVGVETLARCTPAHTATCRQPLPRWVRSPGSAAAIRVAPPGHPHADERGRGWTSACERCWSSVGGLLARHSSPMARHWGVPGSRAAAAVRGSSQRRASDWPRGWRRSRCAEQRWEVARAAGVWHLASGIRRTAVRLTTGRMAFGVHGAVHWAGLCLAAPMRTMLELWRRGRCAWAVRFGWYWLMLACR